MCAALFSSCRQFFNATTWEPDARSHYTFNPERNPSHKRPAACYTHMRDLHVYTDPASFEARAGQMAFYSRRADGPFYRWFYTEGSGRWGYSRVSLDGLTRRMLCVARWETIPTALRKCLGEHYLE